MRRKCYLPKSFEELRDLPNKKLQFYWEVFYTYPVKGRKAWFAVGDYKRRPNEVGARHYEPGAGSG